MKRLLWLLILLSSFGFSQNPTVVTGTEPDSLYVVLFANLPSGHWLGRVRVIIDATSATTCNAGGGSGTPALCFDNGTTWVSIGGGGGGGTPGGLDKQVQFNDGGSVFGGNSALTFDKATGILTAGSVVTSGTTGSWTCTEGTAISGVASSDVIYCDSTAHRPVMKNNNGSAVNIVASGGDINTTDQVTATHLSAALPVPQGGTALTSGTSGGVLCYTASAVLASSGALTANILTKGGGAGVCPTNSLATDNGTSLTYTGTGGFIGPLLVLNGANAGYLQVTQGTAQGHASANTITIEAPASVTAYETLLPGVAASGFMRWANAASVVTQSVAELSGDCSTSNSAAITCTQINGANFTVNSSGLPTKIDGLTTAGQGADIVVAVTAAKSETGADAAVLSFTPPAAQAGYEVCVEMDVSAANTATLGWTATWTNTKGNANAPTNMSLFQMGVAAPALTFTAAANNSYYSCVPIGVNNGAVAIVVKTTFSGTSIAYNVAAWIKRVI